MDIAQSVVYDRNNSAKAAFLFAAYTCSSVVIAVAQELSIHFLGSQTIGSLVAYSAFLAVILMTYRVMAAAFQLEDCVFYAVSVILLGISYIFYPDTQRYLSAYLPTIVMSTFLPYIIGRSVRDTDYLMTALDAAAVIAAAAAVLRLILKDHMSSVSLDEMSFAYSVTLTTVYSLYRILADKKLWQLILFVPSVVVLFLSGTRGPFLCIIAFLALYLLLNLHNVYLMTVSLAAAAGLAAFYMSSAYEKLLYVILDKTKELGYGVRIVEMLINGNIAEGSERSSIVAAVINAIKAHPLRGYGLMGDWTVTQGIFYYDRGTYSHNVFLELWCQYGVIAGSLLIVFFAYLIVRGFMCVRTKNEKGIMMVLASVSVAKLMVSSTYLFSYHVFLFLGYAVTLILREKYRYRGGINEQKPD